MILKRASAVTDLNGVATLYISLKDSPYDSSIRLVCQSGSKVTSPLTKIKIVHILSDMYTLMKILHFRKKLNSTKETETSPIPMYKSIARLN